ncbi:MAG: hypothetical protein ACREK6_17640 [Candidatus Rokuibacteriota bacterium]
MASTLESKLSLGLVAMTLATAGCAAYVWQRPGTPPDVMEQEMRECEALAQQISMQRDIQELADRDWPGAWRLAPGSSSLGFKMQTEQRCMEAKGYRLVKQPARMSPP